MFAWCLGLGTVCLALLVLGRFAPAFSQFMAAGIGRQIHDALYPLISLSLVGMSYVCAARDGLYQTLAVIAAAVVLAAMTAVGSGRIAVIIVLCPLLMMFAVGRGSAVRILSFAGAAGALVIVSIATLGLMRQHFQIRWHEDSLGRYVELVGKQLVLKTIARQGVSGWCLDRVARGHLRGGGHGDPLYFTVAVIPRVLWPEKPNLSRGSEYAVNYCDMVIDPKRPHSESLTLLGEPIINGGAFGLAVAQLGLLGFLAAAAALAFRADFIGTVVLAAMLPWLTQFDQHFALYLANAVKMFLVMMIAVVAWCGIGRYAMRWTGRT